MSKKRKLKATLVESNSSKQEFSEHNTETFPHRKISSLYTSVTTLQCALGLLSPSSKPCVPCAYKIATFDVALDTKFNQVVRNARPEMCPRSKLIRGIEGTYGYQKNMSILTIGDGDFTFSLALARLLLGNRQDDISRLCIVATSYESKSTLKRVYPNIDDTIAELEKNKQVRIEYEVDATNLSETLSPESRNMKFHRIVWNFPCTAETNGQDGQNNEMERNKLLIQNFVRNSIDFLKTNTSEIQMIHKTKPPYDQWNIEELALQNWSREGNRCENNCPLEFKGRIVFDKCLLPPYTPRKALDRKSFTCHDACINIFGFKEGHDYPVQIDERFQATITKCNNDVDELENKKEKGTQIIPVSKAMIDKARKIHLLYSKMNHSRKEKKRKVK